MMKVLSMAWTIYDNRIETFQNSYTGAGMVIKNICEYIGRKEKSYLFIGKCHLSEQNLGNITIVGTDFQLDENDKDVVRDEMYLKNMTVKFELALDRIKPDIVNFHGTGDLMQRCDRVCVKKNIPYVYTEHLYIGKQSKVENYDKAIELETKLYNIPDIPVITVSQGVKRKILRDFPNISETLIQVIPNGTDFISEFVENDYLKKYSLENRKVLLCVGTLLQRKNQMQLVDVYEKLPSEVRERLKIIFCGVDSMQGQLQDRIIEKHLEEDLIYAGAVNREEMKKFYSIADGLIMPSLAEGLSIAALEAIAYGLPIVMFADLEGADELNDQKVTCLAEDRSDEALTDAIMKWYEKEWDRDYIVQFSKRFTMEKMAENYLAYYARRIEENKQKEQKCQA